MKKWLMLVFVTLILCLIVIISRPADASSLSQPVTDVFASITPPVSSPDAPVMEGEDMGYYLDAGNWGPDQALNVTMTVVLPVGTVFKSLHALPPDCIVTTPAAGQTGTVQIILPEMPVSQRIDALLIITPIGPSRTIYLTASVLSDTPDPDLSNNEQTVSSIYSAPSYIDNPPSLVSGYETVYGTATPASPCNDQPAVLLTQEMDGWFTDTIGRPLTYHLISIEDHSPDPVQGIDLTQQVEISGSLLTFIPTSLQADRTFTLKIKAHNGVEFSDDYVRVIVSVNSVPPCLYQIDFDTAGGLPAPDVQSIAAGCKITEPALMSRTGYNFTGWYADEYPDIPWDFATQTVSSSITLRAGWQPVQYPITYVLGSGGANAIGNPSYYTIEDAEIVLLPPARNGYHFDGWFDAETGGNQVTAISIQHLTPMTLYARWTAFDDTLPVTGEPMKDYPVFLGYLMLFMAAGVILINRYARSKK